MKNGAGCGSPCTLLRLQPNSSEPTLAVVFRVVADGVSGCDLLSLAGLRAGRRLLGSFPFRIDRGYRLPDN